MLQGNDLFDSTTVIKHALANSTALEERALGQELRRHAYTIPEKVSSL